MLRIFKNSAAKVITMERQNNTYTHGNTTAHAGPIPGKPKDKISHSEARLLACAGEGLDNTESANLLGLSPLTLNVMWRHIREKLNVDKSIQAVTKAVHLGILELHRIAAATLLVVSAIITSAMPAPCHANNDFDQRPYRTRTQRLGARRNQRDITLTDLLPDNFLNATEDYPMTDKILVLPTVKMFKKKAIEQLEDYTLMKVAIKRGTRLVLKHTRPAANMPAYFDPNDPKAA